MGRAHVDGIYSVTRSCSCGVQSTSNIIFVVRSLTGVFFGMLLATLAAALPAAAAVVPPSGGVKVSINVGIEGSGCKPEDAAVSIASDNSAMTIIFDHFEAADGSKAGTAKSRAFCRVTISINSPGYAFDITSADFRGYVGIDKGVEASLVSRWKWVDQTGADMKGKVRKRCSWIQPLCSCAI